MKRPSLLIQTVAFSEPKASQAEKLGEQLFDLLTRSRETPLAHGPAIPVRIAAVPKDVDLEAADRVVLIPFLEKTEAASQGVRMTALQTLARWSESPHVLVLPVFASLNWRGEESVLPAAILKHVFCESPEEYSSTILEILVATARVLRREGEKEQLQLFISHAKIDEGSTSFAARSIRDFVKTDSTLKAFFDTTDLEPGRDVDKELAAAAKTGVFVAVHSDGYAARAWCQRELLCAKRNKVPTLSVEVLHKGEARSYPYAGNSPTFVWSVVNGERAVPKKAVVQSAREVALRAVVEWLRTRHFEFEAERLVAELPRAEVVCRPPELLDLAQGPLIGNVAAVVLHPDPEVSPEEAQVLRAARPRLHLVTPSTIYRCIGAKSRSGTLPSAALGGRQIALSVSNVIDDAVASQGLRPAHADDATVYLARALVAAGAALAYGGDLRRGGYDTWFAEIISTYRAAHLEGVDHLYSYLPATFDDANLPDRFIINAQRMGHELQSKARLPPPEPPLLPARVCLYLSDMRREMEVHCFARIVLGGNALPRPDAPPKRKSKKKTGENSKKSAGAEGYGGAFPGTVEEAWFALEARHPLYVLGGFGGAARLVADLATSSTHELLQGSRYSGPEYSQFRARSTEFQESPDRPRLGVPGTMEELAKGIHEHFQAVLASDVTACAWNGLTQQENAELFRSHDIPRVTALVMKGLFNVLSKETRGKLAIELVRGDLIRAEGADAIAISMLRDVDMTGASVALDNELGGLVAAAKRSRSRLTDMHSAHVDADWLLIADLGTFAEHDPDLMPERIEREAAEIARLALRHNFRRIALVTFGANLVKSVERSVERMLAGFRPLAPQATLQWFELSPYYFKKLRGYLSEREDVSLTVRELPEVTAGTTSAAPENPTLIVRRESGELRTSLLLSGGPAAARARRDALDDIRLRELNRANAKQAPSMTELAALGDELEKLLFGQATTQSPALLREGALIVQHDAESASLPFEALRIRGQELGLSGGVLRRPSLSDVVLSDRPKHAPSSGKLRVLLVIDPTKDLPAAEIEAREVERALITSDVELIRVRGDDATKQKVLEGFRDPSIDVLHFCGHAYFHGNGDGESGLYCAQRDLLSLSELTAGAFGPPLVFFNACQSARVRDHVGPDAPRALAEYVLAAGVEAYLGTFWPVIDGAAGIFAARVYNELARGKRLHEAVTLARKQLFEKNLPDWANYQLFGNGLFQLKRP